MGELIVPMIFALPILGGVWLVRDLLNRRNAALALATKNRCLLCSSHNVRFLDAIDYRCGACGFDSSQTPRFARELERFRDVKNASWEIEQALFKVRKAPKATLLSPDAGRQLIHEATTHQSDALRYLADLVRQNPTLLDVRFSPDVGLLAEGELVAFARHLEAIADSLRARILNPVERDNFDAMLAELLIRVVEGVSQHLPEGSAMSFAAYELPPRPRPQPR